MGGVGAWKSREKEQAEWRGKWEKEEQEAEQEKRREKIEELRDEGKLGEDWEERIEEREGNGEEKVEEKEGEAGNDDDVGIFLFAHRRKRSGRRLMFETVIHNGYDAQDSQYRHQVNWIRQGGAKVGRLNNVAVRKKRI